MILFHLLTCTNSNIFYVHINRLIYPKYKVKLLLYSCSTRFTFFTAIIPNASSLCTLNVGKIERFYDKLLTENTYNRCDKIRKEKYVTENYSAMVYRYDKYFHFKETIKSY